jgi:hypothetical protein
MTRRGGSDVPAESWARAVVEAVRGLRFGSVEIVVHEGRVVQVETREKVRFDEAGRRRPGQTGAVTPDTSAGLTATRGGAAPTIEDTPE